jgi:hypothetical protein
MARWGWLVGVAILVIALAGCGSDEEGTPSGGGPPAGEAAGAGAGPVPQPRERPLPSGDPFTFEAPFSAGEFVRRSMNGQATAVQTGGLRATYTQGDRQIVLSAYHFDTPADAANLVAYTLDSAALRSVLGTPEIGGRTAFGAAQDRHGGYLAVWSREEWAFLARTTGDLEALNAFLDVFPY